MRTRLTTTTAGATAQLDADELSLLLYPATELEAGPANLWLRRRGDGGVEEAWPLTGPSVVGEVLDGGAGRRVVRGRSGGVQHLAWWEVAEGGLLGWRWQLLNDSDAAVQLDLVCTLDVALSPLAELRRSEQYVSQYLDLTPVALAGSGADGGSTAIAVRQNMPGERQPWAALGSSEPVVGWATDALQLLDEARGEELDLTRELPGERLQHEHTLAALQTAAITLPPGERREGVFWVLTLPDHPQATGPQDAAVLEDAVAQARWAPLELDEASATPVVGTVFSPARFAPVELSCEAPQGARQLELDEDGALLSCRTVDGHRATGTKERRVLRPHGAVLHHNPSAVADSAGLACTVWMGGVFASQLTRGPASSDERLTIRRSYLGLTTAAGLRLLVRRGEGWQLLATPTWWECDEHHARWHYRLGGDLAGSTVEVTSTLQGSGAVQLVVGIAGEPVELMSVLFEANGGAQLTVDAGQPGDDAALFADHRSRGLEVRTVTSPAATGPAVLSLTLGLDPDAPTATAPEAVHRWRTPQLTSPGGAAPQVELLSDFLADMVRDAAVHYQTPRGLEQYTGGAWGTRDVCQGPLGLLLATDEIAALRTTLLMVFAGQQDDGTWPQWFHFLPESAEPGHRDAHGDVVYWPLLALAEYLQATGDTSILDEPVRWVGESELLAAEPVRRHIERAVEQLLAHRTRDPRLPAYGHGDWNDSLQPARPELAQAMCSTWTTELEIKALEALAEELAGVWPEMATTLTTTAANTREAFGELLLADGELAGYAVLTEHGSQLLVHPRDELTGLRHGALQMIHAIADELFTPEQAHEHHSLVTDHLAGPTGVYLFDAPVAYAGGTTTVFKRAEAATFWGREIGLMYTHAHLRWVEALTHLGHATQALDELLKIVPTGITERIPGAAPRQANCYYSSSDASFADREQAGERAADLFDEHTRFEGGWRVYSSGPGLVLRLVTERLLGIRRHREGLVIDPVLAPPLDGLQAIVPLDGRELRIRYHVGDRGYGVRRVLVDGMEWPTRPVKARYRSGGVQLVGELHGKDAGFNLEVWLG